MKKRVLALLLALTLVFALAACGGGTADPTPAPAATEAPAATPAAPAAPATPEGFQVDIFFYSFADTFMASVRAALEANLVSAGMEFTSHDADRDPSRQVDQIRTALTMGTDLIMINVVSTGAEDVALYMVEMAREADVPIIFFNREVSDAVINAWENVIYVGTDAPEAGFMQGELIYNMIRDNIEQYDRNGDGYISYIMFKGELGNPEAQGRTEFSVYQANQMLEAAGLPTLRFYDPANSDLYISANWSAATAHEAMLTALNTNPMTGPNPIELVIANNDDMALGAIEALNGIGFNTGDPDSDYIPVFGVDATDVARDAINAGRMTGTIEQSATGMAEALVFLASNVMNGGHLMDNTASFNIDAHVEKIRIPHGMVS